MDNQLLTTDARLLRIALGVLAILLVAAVAVVGVVQLNRYDPYVQSVLALEGDPTQGNAIFQMNCAGCHGALADGKVGPSLRGVSDRKSRASLIRQVVSGKTPPMPQFQPTPKEMADLLRYLETL